MDKTTPAILKAIAERMETVPGIKAGYYPAPNSLQANKLPAAVVYSGSPTGPTNIRQDMGGMRVWEPNYMVRIYGPRVGNTPQEFLNIDALHDDVTDAFDLAPLVVTVNGKRQHIDRCTVTSLQGSLEAEFGSVKHYAAEVYLSIKYSRPAGG